LLHLRTGKIVEARDMKFREDITASRKYISALLMGRSGGEKIPFVSLPVEYVAEESVRAGAEDSVTSSLSGDQVAVAGADDGADADGAPGSGGESSSSGSDESDSDSVGNLETAPAAAAGQAPRDGPCGSGRTSTTRHWINGDKCSCSRRNHGCGISECRSSCSKHRTSNASTCKRWRKAAGATTADAERGPPLGGRRELDGKVSD